MLSEQVGIQTVSETTSIISKQRLLRFSITISSASC